jgi:hypothetical protein
VIVEAIEERELLRPVGLVFGDIEIDGDQAHAAAASPMPGNHGVGERVAHGEQHPRGRRVLEARDRRLRRQATAVNWIACQQQFVDRILGEAVAIIAVGMPARDREDPLSDQIPDAVRHARRIPRIGDRRREGRHQAKVPIRRFEQDRATVRTGVRLIEGGAHGPIGQVRKQHTLCYRRLVQRNRLRVGKSSCGNGFVPCGGVCVSTGSHALVNYPG